MALRLFEGFGVELEYMIVDARTLAVRPCCDALIAAAAGAGEGEHPGDFDVPGTGITWSNELVLHVVEFKTTEPVPSLAGLAPRFADSVARVIALLAPQEARIMPGAMHPTMDPFREMRLWPHEASEYYRAFDRIFDCRGHGWANLQSVHLNLPFDGDDEFGRLHAAVRLILPILPAIAASSPIMDARITGTLDNRLSVYRTNARKLPIVSGRIIPEPVYTRADYEREVLDAIYRDLAPHDPDGTLRHEWVNARGAIARFTRGSIEVRVLDVQECPAADVAVCAAIVAVLRALVAEKWTSAGEQMQWPMEPLERILLDCIERADAAVIQDSDYLEAFGLRGVASCTAGELWRHLMESCIAAGDGIGEHEPSLRTILDQGPLARRILRAMGAEDAPGPASPERTAEVYRALCGCLAAGTPCGGRMLLAPR